MMTTIKRYEKFKSSNTQSVEQLHAQRVHRGKQESDSAIPNSVRASVGFTPDDENTITSEEAFDAFFAHAMRETRREDLLLEYSRQSTTEKSMFVTALANRGVLDKQKSRKRTKTDMHVDQTRRQNMIADMTDAMRAGGDTLQVGIKAAPDIYKKAAHMMRTAQVSDKNDELSKRSSYFDLKLVNRAFKFLAVIRGKANEADMKDALDPTKNVNQRIQGGYDDEKVVNFHNSATLKEKAAAAEVVDMNKFTEFYKSLRREDSKNIAVFEKYTDIEKQLFVYALANPSKIVKSIGPLRKSSRHNDAARQLAKNTFADFGSIVLQPEHYTKAAMMMLSKDGRHVKYKLSYNQPIVRDAMHFVRAAEMVQVDKLRKKHEEMAKISKDLSGDTKWSATNAIDVARGKMRIDADKVNDLDSFVAFLEKGLTLSGEKYAPLIDRFKGLDQRQKATFIRGLSHRSSTEGATDRSRFKPLQFLGNVFAGSSVKDEKQRAKFIEEYVNYKRVDERNGSNRVFEIPNEDYQRAAINLVSKDTQTRLTDKSWHIDVGMVERGMRLVDDAEKSLRKHEAQMSGGYTQKAAQLRKQFSEGSAEHKKEVEAKGYKAFSGATRQQVKDAGEVKDLTAFESYFQALMEHDNNTPKWETFQLYSPEQKYMFVRALAHRDVLDRTRDHHHVQKIFYFFWRPSYHSYKGREKRNEMKKEFADVGVAKLTGGTKEVTAPSNDEFTAAAYSLISRESRRANWLSTKLGKAVGDARLIDRALDFVKVAGETREKAQDKERNKFMQDNGGAEVGELTRRATQEMKDLADGAMNVESFGEFMAKAVDKGRMQKYVALAEGEKKLFVRALAMRETLDKKDRKTREDQLNRERLSYMQLASENQKADEVIKAYAEPEKTEYRRAAYNVLGSKGRALGTHRFLGIKFGAADNKLLDRAFHFIKETDEKRDFENQAADRNDVMKAFGIAKITKFSSSEQRRRADEATNPEKFGEFLQERMAEMGNERYSLMYQSYNQEAKKLFIAALSVGNKEKRRASAKDRDAIQNLQNTYELGKSERAAAYRLLSHKDADRDAIHFAREMTEKYTRKDFEKARESDKKLTYDKYLQDNGYTQIKMDEANEFEHVGGTTTERTHGSWGRRKIGETTRGFGQWARDTHQAHWDKVSGIVQNLDDGSFKHGAAKFFLKTMNPFLWGKMSTINSDQNAKGAGGINSKERFLEYLHEKAQSEQRVSIYTAIAKLEPEQLALMIQALQDRKMLDASYKDGTELESQDEDKRRELTNRYISGSINEPSAQEWNKAAQAMVSHKVIGRERVMDKIQTRSTVVDWELLEEALGYVQFEAQDEKKMHERTKADQRETEDREHMRTGEEPESFMDQASSLIDTGMAGKDLAMSAKEIYTISSSIVKKEDMKQDVTVDVLQNLDQVPGQLKAALDVKELGSISGIKGMIDRFSESGVAGNLAAAATRMVNMVSTTKDLIQNSVELGMESYDMHKLRGQSDDFDKQMMLKGKVDIVTEALGDAFGMAKELQAGAITEKVFNILDAVCGLVTGGLALGGLPIPIVKLVNNVKSLLFAGARWVVQKIIVLVNGDRIKKLLKVEERTHAYNQRVKAYNARPGMPKSQKRDLMTQAQMQRLLLRQSGLRTEKGAHDYICRKTATCVVYAYGSKKPADPERLAAANLFAGLKVPFQAGGKPPKVTDLAAKLRGAH